MINYFLYFLNYNIQFYFEFYLKYPYKVKFTFYKNKNIKNKLTISKINHLILKESNLDNILNNYFINLLLHHLFYLQILWN